MGEPIIYHIDVNSAFLSWEASYRINQLGDSLDLRDIPSAVGGSEEQRHGIVLAKSTAAKRFGVRTGEPLVKARQKCPELVVVPPNFDLYVRNSRAFMDLLREYAPSVEPFSIDEAFCDMTGTELLYGSPVEFAHTLKDMISSKLGFTVNIGISNNKFLAKTASDFEKPDKVHTLFLSEMRDKFWPLPIGDLLYAGRSSLKTFQHLGIKTIGDLAASDRQLIMSHLGKHGGQLWDYANGLDHDTVTVHEASNKGYGNSQTIPFDITDRATALRFLLSLSETVGSRIRADSAHISTISVSLVDYEFHHSSRQMTLSSTTNLTETIYHSACTLFDQLWDGTPIRQLGVHTSHATDTAYEQYDLFNLQRSEKLTRLNAAVDSIRTRYGEDSLKRACFVGSDESHMSGGLNKAKRNTREVPS
ncbi:MAG: DNA polymerase IV [Lachnospiraceae bacterium]|nr:DNA polymerase IV [Lachnospiraceae bacterium]